MNKDNNITKEYFDGKFDELHKKFATKADLELMQVRFEQHSTDLTSGFKESLKGIGDYVRAIDEKVTNLDTRVVGIDNKLTNMQGDIFFMKEHFKELTSKKETFDLKKRIIRLEEQKA